MSAIDSIVYPGGEFNNPPSSEKINTEVFSTFNGDRPNVLNVAIVITDGVPGISTEQAVNSSTSIQQNSVYMFVVCSAPGCNEDWAKAVASQPTKVRFNEFLPILAEGEEDTYGFNLTPRSISGYTFSASLC